LRSNLFKEREGVTNQVSSEFDLKMFADQFCEIDHIFQTIYQMKFYREILDKMIFFIYIYIGFDANFEIIRKE